MVIRGGRSVIDLVPVVPVPVASSGGGCEFRISVESCGYSGTASVWIGELELRPFVEQLRELEAKRIGAADLAAASPEEFRLTIRSIDRRGHVAVLCRLASPEYAGGGTDPYPHAIECGFEFDPSVLPKILSIAAGWATP